MSIEIELISSMGNDLTVVNAARVSHDKQTDQLRERDTGLIKWMADKAHLSPFRHVFVQFRIRAPEFVARQAYRHHIGIEATSSAHTATDAWNEMSQRYVRPKDFFVPEEWRKAPKEIRQGSSTDEVFSAEEQDKCKQIYGEALAKCQEAYQALLEAGVAREMARMILPLSVETQWIWTMSLQAVVHFIKLRKDPTAQLEIQILAQKMADLVQPIAPVAFEALLQSPHV